MSEKTNVQHLAKLARIEVTEAEAQKFEKEFEAILGYVDTITSVEVDGVSERRPVANVLRDDKDPYEVGQFSDDLLANAPETENDYIKVPKIL